MDRAPAVPPPPPRGSRLGRLQGHEAVGLRVGHDAGERAGVHRLRRAGVEAQRAVARADVAHEPEHLRRRHLDRRLEHAPLHALRARRGGEGPHVLVVVPADTARTRRVSCGDPHGAAHKKIKSRRPSWPTHRLLAGGRSIMGLQSLCGDAEGTRVSLHVATHAETWFNRGTNGSGRRQRRARTRKETFSGASRADGALVSAASSAGLAPASPVLL